MLLGAPLSLFQSLLSLSRQLPLPVQPPLLAPQQKMIFTFSNYASFKRFDLLFSSLFTMAVISSQYVRDELGVVLESGHNSII